MSDLLDRKYSEKSLKIVGSAGASHSFSEEEKEAFSEHINHCLSEDPHLRSLLPLDSSTMDLFEKSNDGLIMCKLINLAQRDAIDERAMNLKEGLNVYQKTENQNLALNAAKAIGCQVVNIGAQDLIEGRPILVLGLVWQIIKIQLLSQISLRNVPELVLLLEDDETMADFLKLHPELILLRWLNYHLEKAGSARRVKNFGSDLIVSGALQDSLLFVLYVLSFANMKLFVFTSRQLQTSAIVTSFAHLVDPVFTVFTPNALPFFSTLISLSGLRGVQHCDEPHRPRALPRDPRRAVVEPRGQGHQQCQSHGRRHLHQAQGAY